LAGAFQIGLEHAGLLDELLGDLLLARQVQSIGVLSGGIIVDKRQEDEFRPVDVASGAEDGSRSES
jgi:hypothetical protein